ncbi:MAG: hypothetical protein ACI8R4_001653 [Paracoccaceae bacterium]
MFDKDQVARAETLFFLVPGGLVSIDIFDPVKSWASQSLRQSTIGFRGLMVCRWILRWG